MDTSIRKLILEMPEWLLKTIDDGLQMLPYHTAAPAINEINRQIVKQKGLLGGSPVKLADGSN